MIKEKKQLGACMIMTYSLLPLSANFLTMIFFLYFFNVILNYSLFTIREYSYVQGIVVREFPNDIQDLIINVLPYFIIMAAYFVYVIPFINYFFRNKGDIEIVKRRTINAPIILGLLGMLGWIIAAFFGIAIDFYEHVYHSLKAYFVVTSFYFLHLVTTGGMCFVISYYLLETMNRSVFIPRIIPDGKISAVKKTIVLSTKMKFFIFYFAVNLYPLNSMGNALIAMKDGYSDNHYIYTVAMITAFSFAASGLLLTYLVSISYQKPLVEMKNSTDSIRNGCYEVKVEVKTNDELGNLGEGINEMADGLKEKDFIKDTFGKVVDPMVRDYLLRGNINLGGELIEATIMFCDIRGFTKMSENMDPDIVVKLLNLYFEKMNEAVVSENGYVNKYIGDALMAVFGAPLKNEDRNACAIRSAIKMKAMREELNKQFVEMGLPEIAHGIGIHSGVVLAGNIGGNTRMEYTVIGDAVNTAARLEDYSKSIGINLVISEDATENCNDIFDFKYIDTVKLKGKDNEIKIFTL